MLFNNGRFGDRTKMFFRSLFHMMFEDESVSPLEDRIRVDDALTPRISDDGLTRVTDGSTY